jgi:hypothetical protein
MAKPALDCPGVVALGGERVAAGVPQHVGVGLELHAGAGGPPPGAGLSDGVCSQNSESRGDQLGDAVAPEDDGSEASCNDREKKRGGYGVFHGAFLSTKDAPAIRSDRPQKKCPAEARLSLDVAMPGDATPRIEHWPKAAVLTANRSPDGTTRLMRCPPASDTKCRMPASRTSCLYDVLSTETNRSKRSRRTVMLHKLAIALAACRTDVFVVRQPLWFGRSMLTWEA